MKSYLGSLTVPAQCQEADVDLSKLKTLHKVKNVADVTGSWTPEKIEFQLACKKFALSVDGNKYIEVSKNLMSVRYPKTLYKKAKKYNFYLYITVWGDYGTVTFMESAKVSVPKRPKEDKKKKKNSPNPSTDYEIPS